MNKKFLNIVVDSFNSCYLVSLLILSLFSRQISFLFRPEINAFYFYGVLPAVNAVLSVICISGLYGLLHKRISKARFHSLRTLQILSAFTGALSIYAIYAPLLTFFVFLVVAVVTVINVRNFLKRIWGYLDPDKTLNSQSALDLGAFLISLVTAFVLLNVTTQALHDFFGAGKAFNFKPGAEGILDSVYFTFTFMTTVGFGDIVPLTPVAKVIVSFECVASYMMLALVIGVVNRGITKK